MDNQFGNILVVKLRYVGDVLLTTPLLRSLREGFPQSRITVLVNQGTECVLQNNSCVDHIAVFSKKNLIQQMRFLNFIRLSHFDCVIDLSDGDRSALLTAISGAKMKIGFNHEGRWRGKVYSHVVKGQYGTMHMLDYHAQTLLLLGIEPQVCDPEIVLTAEEGTAAEKILENHKLKSGKCIVLHSAARYWFKAWGAERFAMLGDALVKEGFQVALVGSPNEESLADEVVKAAKEKIVSLVGRTTLRELAALMKHCCLFIGNDAGPMHIAAAVGCPVVGLFGPTDPNVWGPRGKKCCTIYKGLDCRECFHAGCQRGELSCMNLISVEEVLLKTRKILSKENSL